MAYLKYFLRPIDHAMNTERPSLFTPQGFSPWAENVKIEQKSAKKRWGYVADRSLGTTKEIQQIILFQTSSGNRECLVLTDSDLIKREPTSTWSYKTETYTTGTISGIAGATVTGNLTAWTGAGLTAGDYFIVDSDHGTGDAEPYAAWTRILSTTGDTTMTLSESYKGSGTTGTYKARKVYTTPTNERWTYAIVNDQLYFTNGNTDVQYYPISGYATAVDSTRAKQARYCIEFAQRLVLADLDVSGNRSPITIKYCVNGDPTTWTGAGSGSIHLLESEDFITGLGKVGANLIVYKRDSIILGHQVPDATAPIEVPAYVPGVGCVAPYSIVEFMGTNAFIGRNDFYYISGGRPVELKDYPNPSQSSIKDEFFAIVGETEVERTFGYTNYLENQIEWIANTTLGKKVFVWSWETGEWTIHDFGHDITAGGRGGI